MIMKKILLLIGLFFVFNSVYSQIFYTKELKTDSISGLNGDTCYINSDALFTAGFEIQDGFVNIRGINGINFDAGSDTDIDLMTIGVSGSPRLHWDESAHALTFSTTASTFAINATTGNNSKLSFSENFFENVNIIFDTSPTNKLIFAFPTESDITLSLLDDGEIQIFDQGETDPTVIAGTFSMWGEDADGAGTVSPNFKTEDGTTIVLEQDLSIGSSPTFDATNITGVATGTVELTHLDARKGSAGTILKGSAVYMSGFNSGGGFIEVEAADADDLAKMPAIGVAQVDLTNSSTQKVALIGEISAQNTSNFSVGDDLYVGTDGTGLLIDSMPVGTAEIQKVAEVGRSHASLGILEVFGAGRQNQVPNIPSNEFWLGSGTGVATPTDFDVEVSANTDVTSNTTHKTSDGSDHTFIDQNVTSGASPTFDATNIIFNPRQVSETFSEFAEDSDTKTGWKEVAVGAGSKVDATTQNIGTNNDGVFRFETGTTATGLALLTYGNDQTGFILGGGVRFWECLILIPTLSTAAQEYVIRFGFGDQVDGSDFEDGVYLEYLQSSNVNWLRKTADSDGGVTRTTVNTGIVVAAGSYIRLRAEINAAGTSVEFFVDGASASTNATNLPTTVITPNIHILKTNGTTNRDFFIDYYHQRVIYTTPR